MKYKIGFFIILIAGVILRLYYTWNAAFSICLSWVEDSSTLWLMAKHIVNGEFPLFFYGQYFLGPLESLTMAFFFKLFSIKISSLYYANVFYSALFIVSSYFLGKELKNRAVGLLMMLYAAFPASYLFWASVMPGGYWIEILVLGNLMFILALKIPKAQAGIIKIIYYMLLGAFAGIGVWTHYIILYYIMPVAVYLLINEKWKNLLKYGILTVFSFFIASFPFWIFTIKYNFATFGFKPQAASQTSLFKYFIILCEYLGSIFKINFSYNSIIDIIPICVSCIYCIAVLYFLCTAIFNKRNIFDNKSVFVYLFCVLILFYTVFRSKINLGGTANHLLPIITVVSAAIGSFFYVVFRKIKFIGFFLLIFMFSFNIYNIWKTISKAKVESESAEHSVYKKINFYEDNDLYYLVGSERKLRIEAFFSDEKIIGTSFTDSEYYPYQDKVEAADRVGFVKEDEDRGWSLALNNICTGYDLKNGVYFNFKPFLYRTKVIRSDKWNVNSRIAGNAFDRNINNWWTGNEEEKSFTVDLGEIYSICKIEIFNAHHYNNYPSSLEILTSTDGNKWKESVYIESIHPLFWSGPRPYWHLMNGRAELNFKPVKARFLKLTQIGEDPKHSWEINELFIYEYLGDKKFNVDDYSEDANKIVEFLENKNIDFVYADFWLSAKIRELTDDKIESLVSYTGFLPPRRNMSRGVVLGENRAFIIRKGNESVLEDILAEFELPFQKKGFKNYICYYFDELDEEFESFPSFAWVGIGMVKHSLKECSQWYYERTKKKEEKDDNNKAIDYYKKAVKYYPNNLLAYKSLERLGVDEYGDIMHEKFIPKISIPVQFSNGIRFLGYSIDKDKLRTGEEYEIGYYWALDKKLEDILYVFVHFASEARDAETFFQNDYEFLSEYKKPLIPLDGEVFRIDFKSRVPENVKSGTYSIKIGLWNKDTGERIKIIDSKDNKENEVFIGEIEIF